MVSDCQFQIGDIVEIADRIDPENQPTVMATVKFIEKDNELPGLYWLYLIANEEVLNINIHPEIGYYWNITTNTDNYIRLVSRATIS